MSAEGAEEPLLDISRGDPARSKFLRASLQTLKGASKDTAFHELLDEVLSGKKSLRDVMRSDVFNRNVVQKAEAGVRWLRELSEEERARLVAKGQAEAVRIREGALEVEASPSGAAGAYAFDPNDPLRRKGDEKEFRHATRHPSGMVDDEYEYEFDPSDPLRRNS